MQHLNIYQRQVICFHMFQFSGFWIWWRNIGIGLVITQCHLWFILIEMTFFFLDLLCKHVFKHYYWLGPYSLFHKLCIKNPKMLHLTSHKFYFQVAGQGNVILRIPIFTTFCYAKNMMWVDFKCHKFNNSHFILVTKVTIHYHKKKKDPIFADLDTYNSCYTQIYGKKKHCLSFHTWDIRYLYLLLIFPPFSIKESLRLKYTHPI